MSPASVPLRTSPEDSVRPPSTPCGLPEHQGLGAALGRLFLSEAGAAGYRLARLDNRPAPARGAPTLCAARLSPDRALLPARPRHGCLPSLHGARDFFGLRPIFGRTATGAPTRPRPASPPAPPAALPERQRDVVRDRLAVRRYRRPRHAAALLLPATSRTSPASPFGRSRTSTPCIRTSTRSTTAARSVSARLEQIVPGGSSCRAPPAPVLGDVVLLRLAARHVDDDSGCSAERSMTTSSMPPDVAARSSDGQSPWPEPTVTRKPALRPFRCG